MIQFHDRGTQMNLRQLRAVQTVAELGTAAASKLGLTQSAVSRIISALGSDSVLSRAASIRSAPG